MKKDIAEYVVEHLKPGGLTQIIEVPTWNREAINMDFVVCLPKTRRQHDSIWVIVERITKSSHFMHDVYLQSQGLSEILH